MLVSPQSHRLPRDESPTTEPSILPLSLYAPINPKDSKLPSHLPYLQSFQSSISTLTLLIDSDESFVPWVTGFVGMLEVPNSSFPFLSA